MRMMEGVRNVRSVYRVMGEKGDGVMSEGGRWEGARGDEGEGVTGGWGTDNTIPILL